MKTNSLNFSLSLMEVVVLTNLKLYETLEDKMTYVENFYRGYFNKVFRDKKYVINLYETKFNNKTLLESELDFTGYIKNVHNFIKKAIKFDCLVEQGVKKSVKSQSYVPAPGPSLMNYTVSSETYVDKSKDWSWEVFFQTIREGLTSIPGMILQGVLSLAPPVGEIAAIISWGSLLIYDWWMYFEGKTKYIFNVIEDVFNIIASFIPGLGPKVGEVMSFLRRVGITTIDEILKYLSEPALGHIMYKLMQGFLSVYGSIIKGLNEGAKWLKTKFNADWALKIVGKITTILNDLKKGAESLKLTPYDPSKEQTSFDKWQQNPRNLGAKI